MTNPWKHFAEDLKSSFSTTSGIGNTSLVTKTKVRACSAQELLDETLALPQEAFQWHMLSNDPLFERYSRAQCTAIISQGEQIGRQYASEVLSLGMGVDEVLKHYAIDYDEQTKPIAADRVIFAQYVEPKSITVFTDTLRKYQQYREVHGAARDISGSTVRNVLIAHELFHYLEYRDEQTIATRNFRITTHRLGPITLKSKVSSMSEIAAMEFAKVWLGLDYSPNVFDVLLVRPYEPDAATVILDNISSVYHQQSLTA